MRTLRWLVPLCLVFATLAGGVAQAHPTTSFTACIGSTPGGPPCDRVAAFIAPADIYLRGKVVPHHSRLRAEVLMREGGAGEWAVVDSVGISDNGTMRWHWEARRRDAGDYQLKFRIPGHGHSNRTRVSIFLD